MHGSPRFAVRRVARSTAVVAFAAGMLVTASPAFAQPPPSRAAAPVYTFTTIGDNADTSFNQLLGINNQQVIAGYYGSGTPSSPNRGYTVTPPYAQANFRNENFPGAVQTQVLGLNDTTTTTGFYIDNAGSTVGFVHKGSSATSGFTSVSDPSTPPAPSVNQVLGVNNNGIAVGFYTNSSNNNVPYEYNIAKKTFTTLSPKHAVSAMATGINDQNDVVGTETLANNDVEGWTYINGTYATLAIATKLHSTTVMAFGINDLLQIVGAYVNSSNATVGYVDTKGTPVSITAPGSNGFTIVNGINDGGSIVGFYDTASGDTCVNTCFGFAGVPTPYP